MKPLAPRPDAVVRLPTADLSLPGPLRSSLARMAEIAEVPLGALLVDVVRGARAPRHLSPWLCDVVEERLWALVDEALPPPGRVRRRDLHLTQLVATLDAPPTGAHLRFRARVLFWTETHLVPARVSGALVVEEEGHFGVRSIA